ncbi:MAG: DUF2332 domain-containing protein [Actinobacteria bacterium]|nr:DUF2332 domain-containing protein [Actinomycetota bacterium]
MIVDQTIPEHLRWQAESCGQLGSPLYAHLLTRAADDVEAGGPVARVLGDRQATNASALALRLMGTVHRLVLQGDAPKLAATYPSAGGHADPEAAWSAFTALIEERFDDVNAGIERPVQTNEVGRAGALVGGFLEVARMTGLPLRVFEVGASGGLNLRWDRFFYEARGATWGNPESPVRLCSYNSDRPLPFGVDTRVVERAGCDAAPVDVTTEDGRLTLLSYIWPDQIHRIRLFRAALTVAAETPARVDRAEAVEWTDARWHPEPDTATVVFHSIVMQYLGERRAFFKALVRQRAEEATNDAPLAWLRLEPAGPEAALRLTIWPGGTDATIARSGFHGQNVRWLGS